MPTQSSGRESRRSSRSGPTSDEAYKSGERREKAKSSQIYDSRRRSSRQTEGGLSSVSERPKLGGRTNSAPLIEGRHGQNREQTGNRSKESSSTPPPLNDDGVQDARDEDEVAGVVGAIRHFQPFQNPEVRIETATCKRKRS